MVIRISTWVQAPVERVWNCWTSPEYIVRWNNASSDWHTPWAKIDLRPGGTFTYRMESVDGKIGFDFGGTFSEVNPNAKLSYRIDDGRSVAVYFVPEANGTKVTEEFEAESIHPLEMQEAGWKAILENFRVCVEEGD